MRHLLDSKVGDYQAMIPMVDIDTIGAGGGSIAFVDEGEVFRVGPQSAGAEPGPACYGRGGTRPTATDAQLLLGRLRPDRGLLGGDMELDLELAHGAMQTVADQLGMSVQEAALGALQIQKFGMTQAIELNSVRRGYDPREFVLVAAGGAGPLFACDIAAEPEIRARARAPISGNRRRRGAPQHRSPARVRGHPAPPAGRRRPAPPERPLRGPERPGDAPARAGRRARGAPAGPPPGRLPVRRPGLRGPVRRPRRRDR